MLPRLFGRLCLILLSTKIIKKITHGKYLIPEKTKEKNTEKIKTHSRVNDDLKPKGFRLTALVDSCDRCNEYRSHLGLCHKNQFSIIEYYQKYDIGNHKPKVRFYCDEYNNSKYLDQVQQRTKKKEQELACLDLQYLGLKIGFGILVIALIAIIGAFFMNFFY